MLPPNAPTLAVVKVLLEQAGRSVAESTLQEAWRELSERTDAPTAMDLIALLRERELITGSLLDCEAPPEVLATTFQFPEAASESAGTVTLAPPGDSDGTVLFDTPASDPSTAATMPPSAGGPDAAAPSPGAGGWSYEMVDRLGEGGMGIVYLAFDRNLLRQTAVKRMRRAAAHPGATDRFLYEAQVMSQLDHPNVLPVYGLQVADDGIASVALKLVRGHTLQDLIAQHTALGPSRAAKLLPDRLDVFMKVCEGVHYAHARGVLHRDLKPANVMLGSHGEVYVLDWGLCKLVSQPEAGPSAPDSPAEAPAVGVELDKTQLGGLKGTPLYFSPEQASGVPDAVGFASDQYALGLILYELIALQYAYEASRLNAVLEQAREARVRPFPRAVNPDLAAIVAKATALEPAARYGSVRELAEDVRRALRREETQARPDDTLRALRRWVARHAGAVVSTLLLALLAVGGGSLWLGVQRQLAEAEQRAAEEARVGEERQALVELERRASRTLTHFLWYSTELEGVSSAAELALRTGVRTSEPIYDAGAFAEPATAPPDMLASPDYRAPISPSWPVCHAPVGADLEQVRAETLALLEVRPRFLSLFRGLPGEEAVSAAGPLRPGVAVEWAYVVLESTGVLVLLPGTAGLDLQPDDDIRELVTYREAREAFLAGDDRRWSDPYVDLLGQGRLITYNRALRDPEGRLIGIASLDLSLDEVARRELQLSEGVRWAGILDEQGQVVVATGDGAASLSEEAAAAGEEFALEGYRHADVLSRLEAGEARGLARPEQATGTLVAWQRLDPLRWTLVIEVAPPGAGE
jgi:serine/threonine-protein kinase